MYVTYMLCKRLSKQRSAAATYPGLWWVLNAIRDTEKTTLHFLYGMQYHARTACSIMHVRRAVSSPYGMQCQARTACSIMPF